MIIPLVSSELEINNRHGWDIKPFFSAYYCINGPKSCFHSFLFSKIDGKFANCAFGCYRNLISHCSNQTMGPILSCPITGPDAMDVSMGVILSCVPLLKHQS